MKEKRKIVVAITGASGSLYAKLLLEKLAEQSVGNEPNGRPSGSGSSHGEPPEVAAIFSDNAEQIWEYELGEKPVLPANAKLYANDDFYAPFASGSSEWDSMIICPASMGMIGRIAAGVSDDLISRTADVMLKERRRLIVVPREAPYSLIHLRSMTTLTKAGAIVVPATPSFYSMPTTIEELALTVVERVLDLAGIEGERKRWGAR